MAKPFLIEPHFRLQEWVAEEKGYFHDVGLDYVFQELVRSSDGKHHDRGDKVGAFQSFERGREAAVSCACHWTVDIAASKGKGRLYTGAYSVAPAGIFVPANSPIQSPEQLAGVPISVGYQSGSHYATIQGLEQYLPLQQINLSFAEGMLFARLDRLLDGTSAASTLFSGPYYLAEQLGFRKVLGEVMQTLQQGGSGRCAIQQPIEPCEQHALGEGQVDLLSGGSAPAPPIVA